MTLPGKNWGYRVYGSPKDLYKIDTEIVCPRFSCVIQTGVLFTLLAKAIFFKSRDRIYKDEKVGNENSNIEVCINLVSIYGGQEN